jgi:hypothetical protein
MGWNRLEESEEVLRRSLELRVRKDGHRHQYVADGLQNLASVLNRRGKRNEAEAALTQAYDIYTEVLATDHYQTAFPLLTLSEIRLDNEDFAGAEASASEATRILRGALPDGHFATGTAECRWGRALAGLGRTSEATPLLEGGATTLLTAPRAGRHREPCLRAAVEHLRSIDASPERWAPFTAWLRGARTDSAAAGS